MSVKDILGSAEVRTIVGNAETGIVVGQHSRPQTRAFRTKIVQATKSKSAITPEDLVNDIRSLRFSGGSDADGRITVNAAQVPLHADSRFGHAQISGMVHHVMPTWKLFGLISARDRSRAEFSSVPDVNVSSSPPDHGLNAVALRGITKRRRQFELPDGPFLGYPVLWFTSDDGLGLIEQGYSRARKTFKGNKADWYSSSLGLGHWKKGTWLAVLHIPARVIEAVGHYRPAFCDGAGHPWFMVGSCDPSLRSASEWGQTASLWHLRSGFSSFDGVPERVSHQVMKKDFVLSSGKAPLTIQFDVLGRLTADSGPDSARQTLARKIWQDRSH